MSKPSPEHEIIVHPIAGQLVRQRTRDSYIDATAMCQAAGKRLNNYLRAKRTKKFLKALEADTRIRATELIQVVRGGYPELQGTWAQPEVAVDLGQWLSVEFRVWVAGIIRDWREMQLLLDWEPTDWTKRYPDECFGHIYRLHGWGAFNRSVNPPQIVGHYINDLVWDRLAPGLREAIELRIPRLPSGEHKERMHQMLVTEIGVPKLQAHINVLLLLMDRQSTWAGLMFVVNQALPKGGRHLPPPPKLPQGSQGELDV